ncbi:uncharacterized protein LOC113234573 isoform X2 [Hyposmocoma kahamanoa]|uniref:uncharacterized protein LOC113234573 isoform X2 n=1 Tax=Hyposmocoma kahamanoa TaxID=1477025 RepID=UPI000E6D7283|nr:uncharacterized protein LOC113234573 isoform X2 [Hyposmocoma kahamanoa]
MLRARECKRHILIVCLVLVTKQKKFKIIYKRVESNQQVSSEISEGENANGSEQRATDSEKAVAKIEYVTKPPHRRFATVPSYTEFGPEVAYTPSIYVHVKKRNKANLQRSNVQPVSAELKDNSAYGDSVDIDLLDTINNKRTRKKGNENELKFIQHRPAARQQKEIYINSQNEEISAVSNENVKQNDRLEVDHHQLKIYINNDEIHKLSGMKPQEIHKKLSMTFDNEWDGKQNTQKLGLQLPSSLTGDVL